MNRLFFFLFGLITFELHAQVPDYLPTEGLVAWYSFNGNINDESGNGNNAVESANTNLMPSFVYDTEWNREVIEFDDIDDELTVLAPSQLGVGNTFSFSTWLMPNEQNYGQIVSMDNGRFSLFLSGVNDHFDAMSGLSWASEAYYCGWNNHPYVHPDGWFHMTITISPDSIKAFGNGQLIASLDCGGQSDFDTNIIFGNRNMNTSADYHWGGKLADCGIWNRSLNDDEVMAIFQSSGTTDTCGDFTDLPSEISLENGPVTLQIGPDESSPQADENGVVVIEETGLFVLERSIEDSYLTLTQDSSWVNFGDILNYLTPPVTFSFDVRLTGSGGPIIATDNGNPSYYNGYWMTLNENELACSFGDGGWHGGGERRTGRLSSEFIQNQWYHITCVVNGANDFEYFLNGEAQTTLYNDAGTGGPVNFTNDPMKLGHHNAASPGTGERFDQCFTGDLDNVTVWHRALDETEALALQYGGLPEDLTSLVAFWDFEGCDVGVVTDASGLGHDGLLMGNALLGTQELCTTTDSIMVYGIEGCTDHLACNFDEAATSDDGTCIPSGCMEPLACNYNALAECAGEPCEYTCCPGPGCCLDGTVWDVELNGCVPTIPSDSLCPHDIDFDGLISVVDLMDLLSVFGTDCP